MRKSYERFQSAKSLSSRIAETYRSFGLDAFGFGGSYGKQAGAVSQPVIVASTTLGAHLEDLTAIAKEVGYSKGVIFQLNNLDVGEMHEPAELKYLLNALRDYTQIEGSNWLFVGDTGLRKFIAQQVDRLDDIINYEIMLLPIRLTDLSEMLAKRVNFYRESEKVELPIEPSVFEYLFKVTNGRLRYVFGLISRLMSHLYIGDLTDKVTLDIAKPMFMKLGKDRVQRTDITGTEEDVLKVLTFLNSSTASKLSKELDKTIQYTGRVLASLVEKGLATSQKEGRERIFTPTIDAIIAYKH